MAAIVGGGRGPRPGEASIAHHGVLLLDEFPEFQRTVLEALRQPLEDARSASREHPGRRFPCALPAGRDHEPLPVWRTGDPSSECSCSAQQLARFRAKLSHALLDRFDLVVTVPRPRARELATGLSESSSAVRERVVAARTRLDAEYPARTGEATALLDSAVDRLPLSGRGRARVGRVAATAAALAGAAGVEPEHVAEALSYRSPKELGS